MPPSAQPPADPNPTVVLTPTGVNPPPPPLPGPPVWATAAARVASAAVDSSPVGVATRLAEVIRTLTPHQVITVICVGLVGYVISSYERLLIKVDHVADANRAQIEVVAQEMRDSRFESLKTQQTIQAHGERLDRTLASFERMQSLFINHVLELREKQRELEKGQKDLEGATERLKTKTGLRDSAPPPRESRLTKTND